MARNRQRRGRRTLAKPATAFAGGRLASGQSMGWESIFGGTVPAAIDATLVNDIRTVGAFNTRALTLIPVNVTRGVITMLRVRGTIDVYFNSTELAAAFVNWPVHFNVQLVPARNGLFEPASVLSPQNSADQESNRILWQRLYMPRAGTTITSPGAIEYHEADKVGMELDIKVKRRWDRAEWALMLVAEVENVAISLHQMEGYMRALFSTADGV